MPNGFSNTILKLVQWIDPLPELYLDTNVWIELAKGKLAVDRVVEWVTENNGFTFHLQPLRPLHPLRPLM